MPWCGSIVLPGIDLRLMSEENLHHLRVILLGSQNAGLCEAAWADSRIHCFVLSAVSLSHVNGNPITEITKESADGFSTVSFICSLAFASRTGSASQSTVTLSDGGTPLTSLKSGYVGGLIQADPLCRGFPSRRLLRAQFG